MTDGQQHETSPEIPVEQDERHCCVRYAPYIVCLMCVVIGASVGGTVASLKSATSGHPPKALWREALELVCGTDFMTDPPIPKWSAEDFGPSGYTVMKSCEWPIQYNVLSLDLLDKTYWGQKDDIKSFVVGDTSSIDIVNMVWQTCKVTHRATAKLTEDLGEGATVVYNQVHKLTQNSNKMIEWDILNEYTKT